MDNPFKIHKMTDYGKTYGIPDTHNYPFHGNN